MTGRKGRPRTYSLLDSRNTIVRRFPKLTLPETDYRVALPLSLLGYSGVSRAIASDLRGPVLGVCLGDVAAAATAMPEAAIHEDENLRVRKDEIRRAEFPETSVCPIPQTFLREEASQPFLSGVAAPSFDGSHVLASSW